MIYVEMAGRCGNQLFHYAVARYVQIKSGDKDLIINFNQILMQNKPNEGWRDMLSEFKTAPYTYYEKKGTVLKNETNLLQKIAVAAKALHIKMYSARNRQLRADKASMGQKALNCLGVYWVREGVDKVWIYSRKKSIISGICETSLIYEIQEVLQKELEPKNPVLRENEQLMNEIAQNEAVCVSVRRGDFFQEQNKKSLGVCTPQYYIQAKQMMDERLKGKNNVIYYVFSDDIEWCKSNLKWGGNLVTFRRNCRFVKPCG